MKVDGSTHPGHRGEIVERFEEFLREYYRDDIGELARKYPSEQRSLYVDQRDLFRYDSDIADDYLENPKQFRAYAEQALQNFDLPIDKDLSEATIRLHSLPEHRHVSVGDYRVDDANELIAIHGVVNKATSIGVRDEVTAYSCQRCGSLNKVPQNGSTRQVPNQCDGCERNGPFEIDDDQSKRHDYRALRVQRPPEEQKRHHTEDRIVVHLRRDIVDCVAPGDRVILNGILELEPQDDRGYEQYVEARSVEVLETDFEEIDISNEDIAQIRTHADETPFQTVVDSIAPRIFGHEQIKLAIALQLFGGVTKSYSDGSEMRGHSHIALVGDPGTAKTELLEYADAIAPRSVFTAGKSASGVGLTAGAARDDFGGTEWTLKAGALVRADRGLACLDELDKTDESDRQHLHEAMDQMRVSISKIVSATLPTRTRVLAAANPKHGRFDEYNPIADQIDLDPALWSRFDLLYVMTDRPDEERDSKIIKHKNDNWKVGLERERDQTRSTSDSGAEPVVEKELLRKWIAYARREIIPQLTDPAKQQLEEKFTALRQANTDKEDSPVPITFRKQDAVQRLAEASARLRLSKTIDEQDVNRAFRLVRQSLEDVGIDPETDTLDADIVEVGESHTQRQRRKTLKATIDDLSGEYDEFGVPVKEVLNVLADSGFPRSKLEHDIDHLVESGELIRTGEDRIRGYE